MDVTTFIPEQRHLDWLIFWQQPWLTMDSSWATDFPATDPHRCMYADPALIRRRLALDSEPPPMPGEGLSQWLSMASERKAEALHLIAEIVNRGRGKGRLHDEDIQWGRHLAKALMPGNWSVAKMTELSAEQIGLLLLRQWMSPSTWSRARLFYPKSLFESIETIAPDPVPGQRLNQLWHAVMWRLAVCPRPMIRPEEPMAETEEEEMCL